MSNIHVVQEVRQLKLFTKLLDLHKCKLLNCTVNAGEKS